MKNLGSYVSSFCEYLFKNSKTVDTSLIIVGAAGWLVSMFAQLTSIKSNKEIPKEKKKYLLTQETIDGGSNTLLYLAFTTAFSKLVKWGVESGRVITPDIDKALKNHIKSNGIDTYEQVLKSARQGVTKLGKRLQYDAPNLKLFQDNKNALGLLATIAGSIISCNIITPLVRNRVASTVQEKQKLAELNNTIIKKPELTLTPNVYNPSTFNSFTNITKI